MPLSHSAIFRDEELGKKDDDHKFRPQSRLGQFWQRRRVTPHRRNWRKAVLGIFILIGLYYFYKNIPTDLQNPRPRPRYDHHGGVPGSGARGENGPATNGRGDGEGEGGYYFNGPIKFYQLASSLRAIGFRYGTGSERVNQNVVFAAASLKSVSILLPIACEMGMKDRNQVHFAIMGRDEISLEMLKDVNGIKDECKIFFHDARPDFSADSTDFRMEVSVAAGFNHINSFINSQVAIIDGSGNEDTFLLKGAKDYADAFGRALIELSNNADQNLRWLTHLDASALSAWNSISIDILVHAPPDSSGSLIRLLESLKKSDYSSGPPPRLTIELPRKIDEPTSIYLENFIWPPGRSQSDPNLLALHHRIPQHDLSPEENDIRFLESFWPTRPATSHVLVLSPQAELSPLYFQYLKYSVLEYKHSANSLEKTKNLFGISLELPSTYLNDSTKFEPPTQSVKSKTKGSSSAPTSFLWQAPNSNAGLYFGEKWIELHDFVSRLLASPHQHLSPSANYKLYAEKLVSKTYPSWLEHILKLTRARGYFVVYPNFSSSDAFATLHTELYQPPEEYLTDPEMKSPKAPSLDDELTADPSQHLSLHSPEKSLASKSLLNVLAHKAVLPKISDMPILSWDGLDTKIEDIEKQVEAYQELFKEQIGGCDDGTVEQPVVEGSAGDLLGELGVQEGRVYDINRGIGAVIRPGRARGGLGTYYVPQDVPALIKYTGFPNSKEMHKFLLSRPMLEVVMQTEKEGLTKTEMWQSVFSQIRTRISLAFHDGIGTLLDYWGEHVNLTEKFPDHGGPTFLVYRLAGWIWRLKERVDKYQRQYADLKGSPSEVARFTSVIQEYAAVIKMEPLSAVTMPTIHFPVLGPIYERYEDFMEPYNRIYYLWKHLIRCSFPSKQGLSSKMTVVLKSHAVLEKDKSAPMHGVEVMSRDVRAHHQPIENKPSHGERIVAYKLSDDLDLQSQKLEVAEKKSMLRPGNFATKSWRDLEPWEFRDIIRIKFNLKDYKLQINNLKLHFINNDGKEEALDMMGKTWDVRFMPLLNNPATEVVYINIGLRMLNDYEKLLEDEYQINVFYNSKGEQIPC
ncbi:hypothetical protein B7463_g3447, partial [Scytalidium lignicola]